MSHSENRRRCKRSYGIRNHRYTRRVVAHEPLESRLVLNATGLPGNPFAPDLNLSAIPTQSIRSGVELVLDLRAAGGTVTDIGSNGAPSGDTIRFQLDPDDTPAGATITTDGVFRWTPGATQIGRFEFVVLAIDAGTPPLADAEVFIVEVAANNAPNLAAIPNAVAAVNDILEVTLTASDPDGDNLIFRLDRDDPNSTLPAGAVLQQLDNNTAVIRWTPGAADAGQSVTFSVLVTDDGFPPRGDREAFTVRVMSVAAASDTYTVAVDGTLAIDANAGVLANDTDHEGDSLAAVLVQPPSHGSMTLAADGSFTYTPNAGFRGNDSFTYRAEDPSGDFSRATVAIRVNAVPLAVGDSYAMDEDATLVVDALGGVLSNDSDADGDALAAALVGQPAHGSLTFNSDGSFTYVPDADFHGTDQFTYRINDGTLNSTEATVTITVAAVNDAPVAAADTYTVDEDSTLTVTAAAGVLANDADVDGDTLAVSLVSPAAHGTLTLNGDGSFTYTPNSNFHGSDSFTYRADDGFADSAETTVTIIVAEVNDVPQTAPDEYSVSEDATLTIDAASGVLGNDTDADGDTLTVTLIDNPASGTVVLNSDGSFTYTPAADFHGTDAFTYVASDGVSDSAVTTVSITVHPVNDEPHAAADAYTVIANSPLTVDAAAGVLANDHDADGDTLTATLVDNVSHGTLTLNADGSFTYTPDTDYTGTDAFTYTAGDGTTLSTIATVAISIVAQSTSGLTESGSDEGEDEPAAPEGELGAAAALDVPSVGTSESEDAGIDPPDEKSAAGDLLDQVMAEESDWSDPFGESP